MCKVREATFACNRTRRSCWSASELTSNKLSAPWERERECREMFLKWKCYSCNPSPQPGGWREVSGAGVSLLWNQGWMEDTESSQCLPTHFSSHIWSFSLLSVPCVPEWDLWVLGLALSGLFLIVQALTPWLGHSAEDFPSLCPSLCPIKGGLHRTPEQPSQWPQTGHFFGSMLQLFSLQKLSIAGAELMSAPNLLSYRFMTSKPFPGFPFSSYSQLVLCSIKTLTHIGFFHCSLTKVQACILQDTGQALL